MQSFNEHSLVTNAVRAGAQIVTFAMTGMTNSNDAYFGSPDGYEQIGDPTVSTKRPKKPKK
jgi:hypothetical protein